MAVGSDVCVSVGSGRRVAVGTDVGVFVGAGSDVLIIEVGLLVGAVSYVETGFESVLAPLVIHAILVQPRTPFVQKQLLQELLPVSFPVQLLWTVSPPVSLHTACVVLGVFGSGADKVPGTIT